MARRKTAKKTGKKVTTAREFIEARDTISILTTLIQAVREKYSRDPTSPSVLLSEVGPSGDVYASIVRYHAKWAQQKEVVASVKAKTLPEAVRGLSARWLQVGKAGDRLQRMVL